ncbi:hypothetical protein ACP3P6_02865 [Enterobacter mori]
MLKAALAGTSKRTKKRNCACGREFSRPLSTRKEDSMASLQEGGARPLTIGEIALARSVFGDAIKYSEVKVHNKSYLPFNMQSNNVAMTPNGELYFREPHYRDDFSTEVPRYKHWFIHEMVHVLQHQIGMNVRTRGAFSWAASYNYSLPPDKKLSDFGMEQQASVISDYFF